MRTNFKDGIGFVGAGGMDGNKKGKVNSRRKETFRGEAPSFFETILIEFNCGAVEGDVKRISKRRTSRRQLFSRRVTCGNSTEIIMDEKLSADVTVT